MQRFFTFFLVSSMLPWFGAEALARQGEDASAKKKEYTIDVQVKPNSLTKNSDATYEITIAPVPPWELKPSTPFKLDLTAPKALVLKRTSFSPKDFVDAKTQNKTVRTTVAGKESGTFAIQSALSFFLCTNQICKREKASVETTVTIQNGD